MKNSLKSVLPAALAAITVFAVTNADASQSNIHSYRYVLLVRPGEVNRYAGELANAANDPGRHFDVETDAQGRVTNIAIVRAGKTMSELRLHYSGSTSLLTGFDTFTNGEQTQAARIQRNTEGEAIRQDQMTAQGVLAGYEVFTQASGCVDVVGYSGGDQKTGHAFHCYSVSGVENRVRRYELGNENVYIEAEYDEKTGLMRSCKQFNGDKLVRNVVPAYDANADVVRNDVYDAEGKWFSSDEFTDGLRTKRLYKFSNGGTQEIRYTYDEKRWLEESQVYANNKFICRLTYDILPNGTVKRTLAQGPEGDLWAEYPNRFVTDIDHTGQPSGAGTGAVFYRQGNWW